MFAIRHEAVSDVPAREALLDACFGPSRFAKTCERLREGRRPAEGLSLVVERAGQLAATVRLWHIAAGDGRPALLLGPIAVEPSLQGLGIGAKLMHDALARAAEGGHEAVMLVGDAPYYGRFGFSADLAAGLAVPGPFERERLLGLELVPGAFAGVEGVIWPTGAPAPAQAAPVAEQVFRRFSKAA